METKKIEKLVPDTSVIIEGLVSQKIEKKEISPDLVLIHEAVLAELEHQANQNKAIGFLGLDELNKLKGMGENYNFRFEFSGKKPGIVEIRHAGLGEIDAMIRDLAYAEDATLMTTDKVQARIAETKGIKFLFLQIEQITKKLKLESFFDRETMSVHLRENVAPHAKKGTPGAWNLVKIRDKKLTKEEIQDISREIIEEAGVRRNAFIEIERPGSTIVQFETYRIVITKPPFSDGWEITAVRPVKRLVLADYKMSEKLMKRVSEQAEGILIAGSPGMGKTTFAQALAEYYASKNKIVKTVEAPRDLILPDSVTQYAISHGDPQEIQDILLLSRPDNTLFDEMRNTKDFQLYSDLRLSGVGMAGVVHATSPIDAIQRFVGRIELGVIPQIIDTVIFIKNGKIERVLSLQMTVKVPSGMTEADLARPVVVVNDFETGRLEYELYSYGEETVVVPVRGKSKTPSQELAAKQIEQELRRYTNKPKVEMVSENKAILYVPEQDIAKIIGKQGRTIEAIEQQLGVSIDVQESSKSQETGKISFNYRPTKKFVILETNMPNKDITIYIDDDYFLTARTGKTGTIQISRKNKLGKILSEALSRRENVRLAI